MTYPVEYIERMIAEAKAKEALARRRKIHWEKLLSEAAVSDNLPLDPLPYLSGSLVRFAEAGLWSDRRFDPRPGFSRDESRYREGAGE